MAIDTVQVEAKKATDKAGKIRLLTLDDLDGRTRARQRAEELREHLISERGGAGQIDIMRMAHIDTWTVMTAIIEDQLTRYMRGDPNTLPPPSIRIPNDEAQGRRYFNFAGNR